MIRGCIFVLLALILASCGGKTQEEPKPQADAPKDKYFWIDEHYRLHKYGCSGVRYMDDEVYGVVFVKESDLRQGDYRWYCPRCIDIETYEEIQELTKANVFDLND